MAIVVPTTQQFVELIQPMINQYVSTLTFDQLTRLTSSSVSITLSHVIIGDISTIKDLDNKNLTIEERQYWTNYLTVIKTALIQNNFNDCADGVNQLVNQINK